MELKDAWVSLLGGRLVEQLQTKHLSLTFFYLCEKELILDDISVITFKRARFGRIVINHVILPVLEFH